MNIQQKYPAISYLEARAKRRIPKFAWDYLAGGAMQDKGVIRNRSVFRDLTLTPKYLVSAPSDSCIAQSLLGYQFDAPFGVAPIGLNGLIWPKASEHLSLAATTHNIPFVLSLYATTSLETISQIGGSANTWFQHYPQNDHGINRDILQRAKGADYETLVMTVDVPTTRKVRDIRNGLSLPIRLGPRAFLDVLRCPRWAFATLKSGVPNFENWFPHMPERYTSGQMAKFLEELPILPHRSSLEELSRFRDLWSGAMMVKGILHEDEALKCKELGIDAVIVSNHGGRQLDEAPSSLEVIQEIRMAVGPDYPLLLDGGIRSGGDVALAIALGADFVLLGRAFMISLAALGAKGADHAMTILKEEFRVTMLQLGCSKVRRLPEFLSFENPNYSDHRLSGSCNVIDFEGTERS